MDRIAYMRANNIIVSALSDDIQNIGEYIEILKAYKENLHKFSFVIRENLMKTTFVLLNDLKVRIETEFVGDIKKQIIADLMSIIKNT